METHRYIWVLGVARLLGGQCSGYHLFIYGPNSDDPAVTDFINVELTLSFSMYGQKTLAQQLKARCEVLSSLEVQLIRAAADGGDLQEIVQRFWEAKALINNICTGSAASAAECYEYTERVGKLLALRIRQKTVQGNFQEIRDKSG
ncbi:hypothetical protein NDU88_002355 [Pleurodeles waltl]|uniref:Uncharacterized protein n=1 Tax=Pleurodeles waltl TaxID=8319 RepID=A0AAV7VAB6_PLEWA|nr:hypothetical protein NDU88_002355 [Pleurodeles waltl]